jgi:hypothetical protein
VLCIDVACSLATNANPARDEAGIGVRFDAELGCAQVTVFVEAALVDADGEACASGQKVGASRCQIGELEECGCSFGGSEPRNSGVPGHESGYLGGQDAMVAQACQLGQYHVAAPRPEPGRASSRRQECGRSSPG